MLKVKVDDLKTGDVLAEHIINSERQILLSAGTVLSRKTITLIKLWEIKEIRLREPGDTPETLRLSAQLDEIINKNSHLFETESPAAPKQIEPVKWPVVLSSVIQKKSLQQYDDISARISQFFSTVETASNMDIITTMANIICKYAATTPCVMGYTFQRSLKNLKHEKLINHSMSVAIVAAKLASLLGYPHSDIQRIVLGALLHDIGKTQLAPSVANPAPYMSLNDEQQYQTHVQTGYDLIKGFGLPKEVALIVVQHHEFSDGSGFPMKLTEKKIHPFAQIVAFANMFDHLAHQTGDDVPNFFDIRSKLITSAVNKIDPAIIDIFDRYLSDFIFNINVELNDGRKAEVIYTHPSYMTLVVRTSDGDFIDLSKTKDLFIKKSFF